MKTIQLTRGKFAKVDDDDYLNLIKHRWHSVRGSQNWYAGGSVNGKSIAMHRFIVNAPPDKEVDDRNGNGLDNQKHNLRLCNRQQNGWNSRRNKKSDTQYKGVIYHKKTKSFSVSLSGGHYDTAEQAACIYNFIAPILYGEFARLNTIKRHSLSSFDPCI